MSTYANIDAFVTKHLLLDLTADFDSKTLVGTAELRFERRDLRATEIVLDTRDLQIRKAESSAGDGSWADAAYRLDPATPAFGSALRVTVPSNADRVRITYASSPSARGPAMADAGADLGEEASVPVQPGTGDSGAIVHSRCRTRPPCA